MRALAMLIIPVICCSILSVTSATYLANYREFFALGFLIIGMIYMLYWCVVTPRQPGEPYMGEDDGQGPRLN